jgi:hypothetical protein
VIDTATRMYLMFALLGFAVGIVPGFMFGVNYALRRRQEQP